MKINKRLEHISKYVDDNSKVIDVGCDHALLSIYLEKNKKNLSIIASDINEGPLKQAEKNVKKYESKNISIRLGNGISTIDDDTDTIIISGMGTSTIIDILKADINKLKNIKKIILSPNNDFYLLRKTVIELEYNILFEEFVEDRGKFYPIIVFIKDKGSFDEIGLKYGINVLINSDYKRYLEYLIETNNDIIKSISNDNPKKEELVNENKQIHNILSKI